MYKNMIYLYTGKPGSGKTYILTYLAHSFYKKKQVYSNYFIDLPGIKFFKNLKDLENVQNAIVLIDEAQIYLNSRKWDILPEFFQYKLQQHRKDGIDIFASVQHEARLDTVFREIVGRFFVVKNFFNLIFFAFEYSPDDIKKTSLKNYLGFDFYFFNKKIANSYDTFKKVDYSVSNDDFIYKDTKIRICPKCGSKKYLL